MKFHRKYDNFIGKFIGRLNFKGNFIGNRIKALPVGGGGLF